MGLNQIVSSQKGGRRNKKLIRADPYWSGSPHQNLSRILVGVREVASGSGQPGLTKRPDEDRLGGAAKGHHALSPFDTKDLQQELPFPATGFAFHHQAPVARTLNPLRIADTSCKHSNVQWQAAEGVANIYLLFVALGDRVDDHPHYLEP